MSVKGHSARVKQKRERRTIRSKLEVKRTVQIKTKLRQEGLIRLKKPRSNMVKWPWLGHEMLDL